MILRSDSIFFCFSLNNFLCSQHQMKAVNYDFSRLRLSMLVESMFVLASDFALAFHRD